MAVIMPQPGPQTAFAASQADIVIYGGQAGGGKTFGLEIEPIKYVHIPGFNAVLFRRTLEQVKNPGGLWDESYNIYPQLVIPGKPNKNEYTWNWPLCRDSKAYIKFDGLQYENTKYDFQGAQIALLMFDELTHFTEGQFFYMLSRNRSTCGITPRVRATTNPDGGSWVKRLLAPWVDKKYPNPAKPGEQRYLTRIGESISWVSADWKDTLGQGPKSITYIPASVFDNKALLAADPGYVSNLMALPLIERQRLLFGDWDIMPEAGKVFNRDNFKFYPFPPTGGKRIVRFWDFAATEKKMKKPDPDFTVGVKMLQMGHVYIILDVIAVQYDPASIDKLVLATAIKDGKNVAVRWELEGGASGKQVAHYLGTLLNGFDARAIRPHGDKVSRSRALASQVEAGNVWLLQDRWNEDYLMEMHHFPNWSHDDRVDATAGAYNYLVTEIDAWDSKALGALAE